MGGRRRSVACQGSAAAALLAHRLQQLVTSLCIVKAGNFGGLETARHSTAGLGMTGWRAPVSHRTSMA